MSKIAKPFYTKYYECATLYFYTDEDLRFDLVITCPHADLGSNFTEFDYPAIKQLVKLEKKDFDDFLSIEYDFGTYSLSHAIAQKLYSEYSLYTLIMEPTFPRSILDAGRLYPNCIRNIIDYDQHPKLKNSLVKLYDEYMQKLCHVVAVAKNYNAISIDLHTMSSYSPNVIQERYSEAIIETPETLDDYIDLYRKAHMEGEKRITELFTGDARNGIFASKELLGSLSCELEAMGIDIQYDKPYILAEHLVAHYLVCELETVCIDIPKDLLSKITTADNEKYDIANLEVDQKKLISMAEAFAKAIAGTCKQKQLKGA
ncbi:hypothetical protein fh0823_18730 [Francisella halioticida]|uniref:N-formylglutamate amidohydrolase n=1 Tax=Francisella halioticida TaxID=549298 RepID=A0ABM6M1Y5_9GAMM|nr:hypothetical protein [Francisella halioticida]ASG68769.1 hypothetical protein CDV26_10600 [Francisella halioticida]BCD91734.1 hypothetical protein fh0823_18730 [Francisella halioticida]